MNDPGMDVAIEEHVNDVRHHKENDQPDAVKEEKEEEEAEDDFMQPSRWWFASTACPLIAATFGPMSSAFNLCALVTPWRIYIPPGLLGPESTNITDPRWLLVVNGISLAIAIIANVALLLNMARRISFSIAQPITIIGYYLSSFLLLGLVIATPSRLPRNPGEYYSQAFYYAIISCFIYFTIASLSLMTVYGAFRGHYSRDFKLTMSQRTLMLQTIAFMIYLLAGAAVYSSIEGWKYLDAVYWCDVTLLTVGLGDYSPVSQVGRGLLFPFAIGGILMVGLVIGSIRSLVLERGKKKMGARMVEKTRAKAIQRMNLEKGTVKLTWYRKRKVTANGSSERDRREQEFRVMREIQDQAAKTRRWMSLGVSALVAVGLWLIGAVVFWKSEQKQGWTYFEAVYFSYVALLTIGYGDRRPLNEASKPFFVFWSLLAVPALTILISNMGDTIVKSIRDLALWVGEWTVLPGEQGPKEVLKRTAANVSKGKWGNARPDISEPAGAMSEGVDEEGGRRKPYLDGTDRLAGGLAHQEAEKSQEAARKGDWKGEGKHHYHYLLMKEIKRVMPHLSENPPHRYSYAEWEWFLKLIGQDESSPKHHRSAKDAEQTDGRRLAGMQQIGPDDMYDDQQVEIAKWSWIGKNSPLMGNKDEAEWVLDRLAAALERELKEQRGDKTVAMNGKQSTESR